MDVVLHGTARAAVFPCAWLKWVIWPVPRLPGPLS